MQAPPGRLAGKCAKVVGGAYSSGGRLLYISLFLERGALNDFASKQIRGAYSKGALARVVAVVGKQIERGGSSPGK